jgi:hypothetical protein
VHIANSVCAADLAHWERRARKVVVRGMARTLATKGMRRWDADPRQPRSRLRAAVDRLDTGACIARSQFAIVG